jgi:ribosomal protein S18 acetylase RimI-like enzyme
MKIVEARPAQIPAVVRLLHVCMQTMRANGIDQWDDNYPNEEIVTKDVSNRSLYVVEESGSCLAAVSLNQEQDATYRTVEWLGGEPALVVHRLCVDPGYQGTGIGSHLMDFAEAYATQNVYASIRLDAYTGNPVAIGLYERRGYRRAGQVHYRMCTLPFFCFEKILVIESSILKSW